MDNFHKYQNLRVKVPYSPRKTKGGTSWTRDYMRRQAKKIGKIVDIPKIWDHWWPEASARYGFNYTIVDETAEYYKISILSQVEPDWI